MNRKNINGNWTLLTSSSTFSIQNVSAMSVELLRSATTPVDSDSGSLIAFTCLADDSNLPGSGSNVYGRVFDGIDANASLIVF